MGAVGGTRITNSSNHLVKASIEGGDCGVSDSRVATVTVGDIFHEEGAFACGDPLFRELDALVNSDGIHGIDLTKFINP